MKYLWQQHILCKIDRSGDVRVWHFIMLMISVFIIHTQVKLQYMFETCKFYSTALCFAKQKTDEFYAHKFIFKKTDMF